MEIQHEEKDSRGSFYLENDGQRAAEMVYSRSGSDRLVIEHTEVADELRGRNIGQKLVKAGVEYARTHQLKIVPMCPFARVVLQKKPEWADVLA